MNTLARDLPLHVWPNGKVACSSVEEMRNQNGRRENRGGVPSLLLET